jgi:hypothetical protein
MGFYQMLTPAVTGDKKRPVYGFFPAGPISSFAACSKGRSCDQQGFSHVMSLAAETLWRLYAVKARRAGRKNLLECVFAVNHSQAGLYRTQCL